MEIEEIINKTIINVERLDLAAMLSDEKNIGKISKICEVKIRNADVIQKDERGCTITYFTDEEKPSMFLVIAYYPYPNWVENFKFYKEHVLKDKNVKNTIVEENFGIGKKSIAFNAEFINNEKHNIVSAFDTIGQIQVNAQPYNGKIVDFEKIKKIVKFAMDAVSSD